MTITTKPLRWKIGWNNWIIQQEMRFKYPGIDITSYKNRRSKRTGDQNKWSCGISEWHKLA